MTAVKHLILQQVSNLLASGDATAAAETLTSLYPFVRPDNVTRRYGDAAALRVFLRDGFLDRYSGEPLVFPGAPLDTHPHVREVPRIRAWHRATMTVRALASGA